MGPSRTPGSERLSCAATCYARPPSHWPLGPNSEISPIPLSLSIALLSLALGGASASSRPPGTWAGDVPCSALQALPEARSADAGGASFEYGTLPSAETWESVQSILAGSTYGEPELDGDLDAATLDWGRHRVVFVAFAGATRILEPHTASDPIDGVQSLAFSARASRRPESPEGPCSLLLWRVDVETASRVRLLVRAGVAESLLAELELSSGARR